MATSIEGYDTARIIEALIATLVQKKVITENEANYIKKVGKEPLSDKAKRDMSRLDKLKPIIKYEI